MTRPTDRLRAAPANTATASTDELRARSWRYDERMEAMARLRDEEPERFAAAGPRARIALGLYVQGKAAAKAAGLDTTGGSQ